MTEGTEPLARATGLDHVVFKVADPEASLTWYQRVLGLEPERLEEWRRGEAPFVSVRIDEATVIDLFEAPPDGRNVDHVAIVVEGVDLEALAASGEVDVVGPPARVWGARGYGTGLYVSDPDGNTVELRVYGAD